MAIQINSVKHNSYVDGPGCRSVIFFQGCTLACRGCQNKDLWPSGGGEERSAYCVAYDAITGNRWNNVTISGGEPFQQPGGLAELVSHLKEIAPRSHVIVYTGYDWAELFASDHPARAWLKHILERVDVLVTGRFLRELDHGNIMWRGSTNQQPINVQATIEQAAAGLRDIIDEPVVLDWENPEVIIGRDGDMRLPIGLENEFGPLGISQNNRRCGEVE